MLNLVKIKQFWQLFNSNKVYFASLIILVAVDAYQIAQYYFQAETISWITILSRVLAIVATALNIFIGVIKLKKIQLEKFFKLMNDESEKNYFHGFKFQRYVDSQAILRLEHWLGTGICYELAALTMILMKNNKSAKLCKGDYYKNGHMFTVHAWVEVKVPLNGWYVADFAWATGPLRKKDYFNDLNKSGRMISKWNCKYKDFWKIRFSEVLSKAMKNKDTSYVLLELSAFGGTNQNRYGFKDWIYEENDLKFSDGKTMFCHYRGNPDRPISTRIIRDFVKNPKRKSPKAKSIRLAQLEAHKNKAQSA